MGCLITLSSHMSCFFFGVSVTGFYLGFKSKKRT